MSRESRWNGCYGEIANLILALTIKKCGTYVQVTVPLFLTYFNDCDHFSLTYNMFTALKSC